MRILQVHNFYQVPGGEDAVVANEAALLAEHGHEVRLWSLGNHAIGGPWERLKTAWTAPYSEAARDRLRREIAAFEPDVVHVHNFFPLITPAAYDACRDAAVPVVQTLHNYRTICASALLFRAGRPCEDCIGASPYQAVLHGCYRGSRPASLAVARMVSVHRRRDTWRRRVARFIALTEFAKAKFVAAGFPAGRIVVKPNFAPDHRAADGAEGRDGALFVGRLSPEKGLRTLLDAWRELNVPVRIAGDGPMLEAVRGAARPTVTVLGRQAGAAVRDEMARAAFLVVPSESYEGFPMALVEAFCQGLPVIASRLGAMAEIVEDGTTGLHFEPGDSDDLAAKVRWAAAHPAELQAMGRNARRTYEAKYSPDVNYRQLVAVYEDARRA